MCPHLATLAASSHSNIQVDTPSHSNDLFNVFLCFFSHIVLASYIQSNSSVPTLAADRPPAQIFPSSHNIFLKPVRLKRFGHFPFHCVGPMAAGL